MKSFFICASALVFLVLVSCENDPYHQDDEYDCVKTHPKVIDVFDKTVTFSGDIYRVGNSVYVPLTNGTSCEVYELKQGTGFGFFQTADFVEGEFDQWYKFDATFTKVEFIWGVRNRQLYKWDIEISYK